MSFTSYILLYNASVLVNHAIEWHKSCFLYMRLVLGMVLHNITVTLSIVSGVCVCFCLHNNCKTTDQQLMLVGRNVLQFALEVLELFSYV